MERARHNIHNEHREAVLGKHLLLQPTPDVGRAKERNDVPDVWADHIVGHVAALLCTTYITHRDDCLLLRLFRGRT